MSKPAVLPPDYPLTYAKQAVNRGLEIEGHLLTAGEAHVLECWQDLSDPAAHAYARLIQRRVFPVRVDQFHHPALPRMVDALSELAVAGFLSTGKQLPRAERLQRLKVPELRANCRHLGLPHAGNKGELLRALSGRHDITEPAMVSPRHRGLFRRVFRAALQNHAGDLSREVLDQMGVRRSAEYALSSGSGRFRNRLSLVAYEEALVDRHKEDQGDHLECARTLTERIESLGPPQPWEYRFSAYRQLTHLLVSSLRNAERTEPAAKVATAYRRALSLGTKHRAGLTARLALVEERAGRPGVGLEVCLSGLSAQPDALALHRTGSRLARKVSKTWPYPRDRVAPKVKKILLPQSPADEAGPAPPQRVERAVITALSLHGRRALHSENGIWTTLFALIYDAALFEPVDGALPCPHLTGPLDLGTTAFRSARHGLIEEIQNQVRSGEVAALITAAWNKRQGQAVAGAHWTAFDLDLLTSVAKAMAADSLNAIMDVFIDDWYGAKRGLPDLTILPGAEVSFFGTVVEKGLKFVEIKGPGDTLRDRQAWWLRALTAADIDAEVWQIKPLKGMT